MSCTIFFKATGLLVSGVSSWWKIRWDLYSMGSINLPLAVPKRHPKLADMSFVTRHLPGFHSISMGIYVHTLQGRAGFFFCLPGIFKTNGGQQPNHQNPQESLRVRFSSWGINSQNPREIIGWKKIYNLESFPQILSGEHPHTRWCFQIFLEFSPRFGENFQFDLLKKHQLASRKKVIAKSPSILGIPQGTGLP